jgi:hypothetical protein
VLPTPGPLSTPAQLGGGAHPGYVAIPAGRFLLGATAADNWVFDAERWAHAVPVPSFRIAKATAGPHLSGSFTLALHTRVFQLVLYFVFP